MRALDGAASVTRGRVVSVEPPHRLVLTWADEDWPAATEVELTVTPEEAGTRVRVIHRGWAAVAAVAADPGIVEAHRQGWAAHLATLAAWLQTH